MRPLVLGYLRLKPTDTPEIATRLEAELHAYAEREGLTLADIYTERVDSHAQGGFERPAFCALMDTLSGVDMYGVLIPSSEHVSSNPRGCHQRRTVLEVEAGARLFVVHP